MNKFLKALGLITLIVGVVFLNGFVVMKLWGWFIVPFGLAQINFWHAYGLATFVQLFQSKSYVKDEYKESRSTQIASGIFIPLFTLLIGWVAQSFM